MGDENLAVAHVARRHLGDDLHQPINLAIGNHEFELHLGRHVQQNLGAAVVFLPAMLTAASVDLEIVMPPTFAAKRASLSGSSFSGRTIARILFIGFNSFLKTRLVKTDIGRVRGLAVCPNVEALRLFFLADAQAALEARLHDEADDHVEHANEHDRTRMPRNSAAQKRGIASV